MPSTIHNGNSANFSLLYTPPCPLRSRAGNDTAAQAYQITTWGEKVVALARLSELSEGSQVRRACAWIAVGKGGSELGISMPAPTHTPMALPPAGTALPSLLMSGARAPAKRAYHMCHLCSRPHLLLPSPCASLQVQGIRTMTPADINNVVASMSGLNLTAPAELHGAAGKEQAVRDQAVKDLIADVKSDINFLRPFV